MTLPPDFIKGVLLMPVLTITDLTDEGQGIARISDLVVFVDGALPGETVRAEIITQKKKYAQAATLEILEPSPDRIEPFCPHFGRCGGCTMGIMKYQAGLRCKTQMVQNKLERIGGFSPEDFDVEPIIGMDFPYHFRNKASFPIGGTTQYPIIGMYARGTHTVIPVPRCPVQHPVVDAIIPVIAFYIQSRGLSIYNERTGRGLLRHLMVRVSYATGQVMVVLVTNGGLLPDTEWLIQGLTRAIDGFDPTPLEHPPCSLRSLVHNIQDSKTNVILGSGYEVLYGEDSIEENILGHYHRISPLSFFQTNPIQTEVLFQEVLGATVLRDEQTVLDLYCGAGVISLLLARKAGHVIGVDIIADAVRDAEYAAERAGLDAIAQFVAAAAEDWLPAYLGASGQCHLAVLDPPRKGCDERLIEAILESPPPRLIYISCDPGTLARDLGMLRGSYRICSVQPVDMFPWTTHVETVVLLARIGRTKSRMDELWAKWEQIFDEEG